MRDLNRCLFKSRMGTRGRAAFFRPCSRQKYRLTNWPIIEKMTRNSLAAGTFEGGQIKLDEISRWMRDETVSEGCI
jgi:hypothetical protein